jgi:hypothetical protein
MTVMYVGLADDVWNEKKSGTDYSLFILAGNITIKNINLEFTLKSHFGKTFTKGI